MVVDPEISVIIPTRDRAHILDGALDSLVRQNLDPRLFEIIVVDDGSSDHTADLVEAYGVSRLVPKVDLVRNPRQGVNRARNAGLHRSTSPIVCFLDDDEVAPAGHLKRVLEHLHQAPHAPGVGGPAIDSGDSRIRTCSTCDLGSASLPISGVGSSSRLLGGNMAIRRVVFDEVGEFDEELSGRGDETEWFERASRVFTYDESLWVWHRRVSFSLMQLARIQFEQGRSIPIAAAKRGEHWRPSLVRLGRYVGHAIVRRCGRGGVLAARDLGAGTTWLMMRANRSGDT